MHERGLYIHGASGSYMVSNIVLKESLLDNLTIKMASFERNLIFPPYTACQKKYTGLHSIILFS